MLYHRGDSQNDRRVNGRCLKCGERPAEPGILICQPCHKRVRANYLQNRRRGHEVAKQAQAEAERRRLRACREVTVDGQTFIVTNSYVTESAHQRIPISPNPFRK